MRKRTFIFGPSSLPFGGQTKKNPDIM